MDAIYNRSSVRSFSADKVSAEDIEALLRAAMAAPSAGNQQPWEFYVVQDEAKLKSLATASPYAKPASKAPCVIVPCVRTNELRFAECAPQDMSAAIENMLLEACELGLGTVWMGIAPAQERMERVAQTLVLPEGIEPFALVAVGYPAEIPNPQGATRYDAKRIHWV